MKFENNFGDRVVRENKKKKEVTRRGFLKYMLLGAGAVATSKFIKFDEVFNFFDEDENRDEKREIDSSEKNEDVVDEEVNQEEVACEIEKMKKEMSEAEKVICEILRTYNTPGIYRRFDPKVFTKDFFMAQQYQESRYRKESVSNTGAKGIYQDFPAATQEVVEYLSFLKKETRGMADKDVVDYDGPDKISYDEASEIGDLFKEHGDYGRSVGKLYLLAIHDPVSKFNNGKPNKDVFRGKSSETQQELLLLAYHDGPGRRYSPSRAKPEGVKYVKLVKKHMDTISDIRDGLENASMSRDLDYAIIKILRELERPGNRKKQKEIMHKWLVKLQQVHMRMWEKTGKVEEKISNKEVRQLFSN